MKSPLSSLIQPFDFASDRDGLVLGELDIDITHHDAWELAVEFVGGGCFADVEAGTEHCAAGVGGWFGMEVAGLGFEGAEDVVDAVHVSNGRTVMVVEVFIRVMVRRRGFEIV
jgi:hypothetical protein